MLVFHLLLFLFHKLLLHPAVLRSLFYKSIILWLWDLLVSHTAVRKTMLY